MKKFTVLFLMFLLLSVNWVKVYATPNKATNIFTENLYKPSDLNIVDTNVYSIENISNDKAIYVIVYNENQKILQAIQLGPKSKKYELIPIKPEYRIGVVGGGQMQLTSSPISSLK